MIPLVGHQLQNTLNRLLVERAVLADGFIKKNGRSTYYEMK